MENSQLNYIERLVQEKERMQVKARCISKMERIEGEMVNKMSHTINRQKEAATML